MIKNSTLITAGLILSLSSLHAQTACPDDRVAYVESKNIGATGAFNLSIGGEEKAAQTYTYAGPGRVSGAKVYGTVPPGLGITLRVSLYNVDANGRPTGISLATAPLKSLYPWSDQSFEVSFSPAAVVTTNFALVVEIVQQPGRGHDFLLRYTGNDEGLGEDLASLSGTSTGFNWASSMTDFSKDGDFYIMPRMTNINRPQFSVVTPCVAIGTSVAFSNTTQMTTDSMFNLLSAPGYSGANFLYTWNFGDGSALLHTANPSHIYTTAGQYVVSLTTTIEGWDGLCTETFTKSISVGLSANTTNITSVSCNNGNNGSFSAVATGGDSPYTYSLNGSGFQSTAPFTGLVAGAYTLHVKDGLGCVKTSSFTINQPEAIQFSMAISTNASCGNADGGVSVSSIGGIAPVQYKLNAGNYQSSGSFTGLTAGGYVVTAKDANGCTFATIIVVNNPGGVAFGITNSTNVSCSGGTDGSISLTSVGGTGAIQYSINGGISYQSSGQFTNVGAGTYTVMVKDAAACTEVKIIQIHQPSPLSLEAIATDLSCFGNNTGEIDVLQVMGGTGSFSYSLDGINYQSGSNFPGLAAGTYTITVKDVAGCMNTNVQTIHEPSELTASIATTNASCFDYQDGSLTIAGSGGTAAYIYSIGNESILQNSTSFDHLAAGEYTLFVVDSKGCIYQTTATIGQPSSIIPIATTTNSTCGNSNGGFLASGTGGSGSGYTYSVNGGTYGNGSFSSLSAGTYVITSMDGTGCFATTNAIIFDSNGPSIQTSTHTNISCHGGNDGSITVGNVTGGTGTLLYSINGITYQSSTIFNGLLAGVYNVLVKDAVGCIGNSIETLTEPNDFAITPIVVNAICNNENTGSINVLVGGGSGTLTYSIDDGDSYQSSSTFANLTAGSYSVIVKDAGGCKSRVVATIGQPTAITAIYSSLNVSCHGALNGTLNVTANGGTGEFQYSVNASQLQASNIFTALSGGTYNVLVQDAVGCTYTFEATVNEPTPLVILATVSDVTCASGNNGEIDINLSGGISGYLYNWSNGVITEDNLNLSSGAYSVVVTDGNGCTATQAFLVDQPSDPLIVNGTVTNSTGASDGAIDITPSGGVGSYTYQWSNNLTTADISGLDEGTYSVIVTDTNGCSASSTFVVAIAVGTDRVNAISHALKLYPNPANDYVTLALPGFTIQKVEVYDFVGKLILSSKHNSSLVEINTMELNQGLYFVRILGEGTYVTKNLAILQ